METPIKRVPLPDEEMSYEDNATYAIILTSMAEERKLTEAFAAAKEIFDEASRMEMMAASNLQERIALGDPTLITFENRMDRLNKMDLDFLGLTYCNVFQNGKMTEKFWELEVPKDGIYKMACDETHEDIVKKILTGLFPDARITMGAYMADFSPGGAVIEISVTQSDEPGFTDFGSSNSKPLSMCDDSDCEDDIHMFRTMGETKISKEVMLRGLMESLLLSESARAEDHVVPMIDDMIIDFGNWDNLSAYQRCVTLVTARIHIEHPYHRCECDPFGLNDKLKPYKDCLSTEERLTVDLLSIVRRARICSHDTMTDNQIGSVKDIEKLVCAFNPDIVERCLALWRAIGVARGWGTHFDEVSLITRMKEVYGRLEEDDDRPTQ